MIFRADDADCSILQVDVLDSQPPGLPSPQSATVEQAEEYRENKMSGIHSGVRFEFVTGPEECGKLFGCEEMGYIAIDLAVQSGRKNEGVRDSECLHVLAQFTYR